MLQAGSNLSGVLPVSMDRVKGSLVHIRLKVCFLELGGAAFSNKSLHSAKQTCGRSVNME